MGDVGCEGDMDRGAWMAGRSLEKMGGAGLGCQCAVLRLCVGVF